VITGAPLGPPDPINLLGGPGRIVSMEDLATLDVPGGAVTLRQAVPDDLPEVVALLAADQLGAGRENLDEPTPYRAAFDAITADPAHLLVVAVDGGRVIGTMQLSFLPGLARRGAWRAQIEAVRVHEAVRNRGVGARMIGWAIDTARRRGCALVQLTTDKRRADAHRFYERLGFVASHEGMKLAL
jgi:GNAT superfamily N-acetyltransferase